MSSDGRPLCGLWTWDKCGRARLCSEVVELTQTLTRTLGKIGLGSRLGRSSIGSIGVKLVSTLLVFAYGLLLARLLSPHDFGTYEYVVAWLILLTIPGVFGLDKLLVRAVAASVTHESWGEVRGIVRWSTVVTLVLSLAIAVAAGLIAWFAGGREITPTITVFWLGCAFVPLTSLTMVNEGALRGLKHVVTGQVPIMIVRPLVAAVLIGGGALLTAARPDAIAAVGAYVLAALVALIVSAVLLRRSMPADALAAKPVFTGRSWLTIAAPLMLIGGLNLVNTRIGTIALGALGDAADAGVYAVAVRGAELVAFTLVAVNTALAPTFASLFSEGDRAGLQRLVTRSTRLVLATALPLALGLLLLGRWFLLLYGEPFLVGRDALSILVLGQFIGNVSMGSVGFLLMMTGFERDAVLGYCVAIAANVLLSLTLIPAMGVTGAAWAAAISTVMLNLLLTYFVYRRLKIHATALGAPR